MRGNLIRNHEKLLIELEEFIKEQRKNLNSVITLNVLQDTLDKINDLRTYYELD